VERHDVRTTMVERSGCPSRAGVITQITRDLSPGTHDISFTIVILPNQGEMTSYFGRSHCNESVITQGTERSMTSPVNRRVTHLLRNTGLLSNGDIDITISCRSWCESYSWIYAGLDRYLSIRVQLQS